MFHSSTILIMSATVVAGRHPCRICKECVITSFVACSQPFLIVNTILHFWFDLSFYESSCLCNCAAIIYFEGKTCDIYTTLDFQGF